MFCHTCFSLTDVGTPSIENSPTVTYLKLRGFGRDLCVSHSGGGTDAEGATCFSISVLLRLM